MNSPTDDLPGDVIAEAYAPSTFARLSELWQQALHSHFNAVMAAATPVLNWKEPTDAVRLAGDLLTQGNQISSADRSTRFEELVAQMLASGQNLHHPHYIGHQVPASVPVAGLFDAVGSLTNQPMAIYEMGPWATAVEHALVRALCGKVGWAPDESCGVLTSGGSLANLTALLTARNVAFPGSWENGIPDNAVLIAHTDAHYCVARSAGILGLGTQKILKAPLDQRRRIDPVALEQLIVTSQQQGRRVMAVVACACATPIGAFDPIIQIADICTKHRIWLHVDAAHGGAALMSRTHRSLLNGLDQVDSVVWDAHKMMFVPALCAAVLYRNREHRYEAFQQDAPYLFDPSNPGMADYDNGVGTVECTKRTLGFGLWGLWSMFGESIFEDMVDRTFALCRFLYERILAADDFSAFHEPDCNILVFQHLPAHLRQASGQVKNEFQRRLRASIVQSGEFYIVQTTIDGVVGLRICVMNPLTSKSDLSLLLESIRETGRNLAESPAA